MTIRSMDTDSSKILCMYEGRSSSSSVSSSDLSRSKLESLYFATLTQSRLIRPIRLTFGGKREVKFADSSFSFINSSSTRKSEFLRFCFLLADFSAVLVVFDEVIDSSLSVLGNPISRFFRDVHSSLLLKESMF